MDPKTEPAPSSGKQIRVLLVDDDATHQYSLSKHLVASGFDVLQAQTGMEAVGIASQSHPDVILLDIHLQDTLGFDVCRKLKADETTKSIPVVFHSATHNTQSAKAAAMNLGADAFLTYPIDITHLTSVLRGAVARGSIAKS